MDFVELYRKSFPQLTPEEAGSLHSRFRDYGVHSKWIFSATKFTDDVIAQGDLFSGLYASYYDAGADSPEGSLMTTGPCEAIVITNTCDNEMDRDPHSVFVPLFVAKSYFEQLGDKDTEENIKKNVVTSILYLPGHDELPDHIADFSISTSFSKEWLKAKRSNGTLIKKASLTVNGYYFLLAKLTLHLMRPESSGIVRNTQ